MAKSESAARMADAANSFLDALDDDARRAARVPFSDATGRQEWHYVPRRRAGLSFRSMDATQQQRQHYLDRLPAPEAGAWWARLVAPGTSGGFGDVRFAFAGDATHRRPQYYRVAGPGRYVEYDTTQDDAKHVHTVLRDPDGDFGLDLLRRHRADHH